MSSARLPGELQAGRECADVQAHDQAVPVAAEAGQQAITRRQRDARRGCVDEAGARRQTDDFKILDTPRNALDEDAGLALAALLFDAEHVVVGELDAGPDGAIARREEQQASHVELRGGAVWARV